MNQPSSTWDDTKKGEKNKMNFNEEQDTGIWSACLLQKCENFKVIFSVGNQS